MISSAPAQTWPPEGADGQHPDAAGRLRFANRAGEALLASGDGLAAERDGTLRAARPADTASPQRLLAEAMAPGGDRDGGSAALRLPRPSGRAPLVVTTVPLSPAAADLRGVPGVAALLLVTEPATASARAPGPGPAVLRERFGLTAAEAAVALRVARGGGVPAVAAVLGVAPATARFHLKSVFEKTGTHSQAELAGRLAGRNP